MSPATQKRNVSLSANEMSRIAKILQMESGIEIPNDKTSLVQSRLARRLRETGLESYAEYCSFIEGSDGTKERENMLSALTTNHTKFFREEHHFIDLRDRLLPPLLREAHQGGTIRIWSAGCSSGEEPYSIAMTILLLDPTATEYDIRILATDIDPKIIESARSAIYKKTSVAKFDGEVLDRFFEDHDEKHRMVKKPVRDLITFNRLNLHAQWPMKRKIDLIFCRNVVIYFEKTCEIKLWKRMVSALNHGGSILVGHSERIPENINLPIKLDGITTYRKTT